MSCAEVRDSLAMARVVPIIRHHDFGTARDMSHAAAKAGADVVEITMDVPDACRLVEELSTDGLHVGIGTVSERAQVRAAVSAGARFVVSPFLSLDVVEEAAGQGALPIPGVFTPTEAVSASSVGALVVKLFPAGAVTPGYIAALRTAAPQLDVIPTGGIDEATADEWLCAGALAVGIGSALNAAYAAHGAEGVTSVIGRALKSRDGSHDTRHARNGGS